LSSARAWLAAHWRALFLEVDTETAFPESQDELRASLHTDDPSAATELLVEAEAAHDRLRSRVEGAERRATTLQGASAIAASLTLAAAGLLIDPTKLRGWVWQLLFGLAVLYITFALAMCAWRATLASSRVHNWVTPPDRDILDRPGQGIATARLERAIALLRAVGGNQRFARYKIAMLRAATEWIVRALVGLVALALLSALYSLFGPDPEPRSPTQRRSHGTLSQLHAASVCCRRPPSVTVATSECRTACERHSNRDCPTHGVRSRNRSRGDSSRPNVSRTARALRSDDTDT
jgi:hypothetical protein